MSNVPFDARSPGEMLRTAREKQGLHIAALAAAIKVSPRKLDSLEHDRWHELPDATFVRALAQTVCRTLKSDPVPVLALLPPPGGLTFERADRNLSAPFHNRPVHDEPGLALGAIRPMVLAAIVLMLAAVALVFVPDRYWSAAVSLLTPTSPPATAIAPAAASAVRAAPPMDVLPVAASAPAPEAVPGATVVATGVFPPLEAVPPLSAVVTTVPTTVTTTLRSALPTNVTATVSTNLSTTLPGALQVRTTGASWIEARDGGGRVLLSRVVQPGESLGLDGSLPIRVTIGNAAVTRLDFRGQPVDLAPATRDNVVRIELK